MTRTRDGGRCARRWSGTGRCARRSWPSTRRPTASWPTGPSRPRRPRPACPLTHLGAGQRDIRISFADIVAQPRRILTTPTWSGLVAKGRAYSPFTLNVEHLVPWRTLTGRQHFYLDHEQVPGLG